MVRAGRDERRRATEERALAYNIMAELYGLVGLRNFRCHPQMESDLRALMSRLGDNARLRDVAEARNRRPC
jgi:hypothetical protein